MRLLTVVEYFPPVLGHDLRIYELSRRMPRDWDVHFLALPSLRRLLIGDRADAAAAAKNGHVVPHYVTVPRWFEPCWRQNWVLAYLLSLGPLLFHAARAAKKAKPDVVVANYPSPYTGLLAFVVSRLRSVPYVVDLCDDIAAYFEIIVPGRYPSFLNRVARAVQDFLIRRSAVLPVVTHSLRDYAVRTRVDPAKIEVLPNGVDLALFARASGLPNGTGPRMNGEFACFYGGSVESWAGSNLLVDLARRAEREGLAIEIAVAGNPLPASRERPPKNLHHLGLLDKEGVAHAIRASDCVLVPLQPGVLADATSPVKLFEGLAAGKPCICSRVAGICDVIEDGKNGLLMDGVDPAAWLDRIRGLASDAALQHALAERARTTATLYDWNVLAGRFAALLGRAFGSP